QATSSGQRPWASRRRIPRRTPLLLAVPEQASTRLATNTPSGTSGASSNVVAAATTGQSGHQTTRRRNGGIAFTPPPAAPPVGTDDRRSRRPRRSGSAAEADTNAAGMRLHGR